MCSFWDISIAKHLSRYKITTPKISLQVWKQVWNQPWAYSFTDYQNQSKIMCGLKFPIQGHQQFCFHSFELVTYSAYMGSLSLDRISSFHFLLMLWFLSTIICFSSLFLALISIPSPLWHERYHISFIKRSSRSNLIQIGMVRILHSEFSI